MEAKVCCANMATSASSSSFLVWPGGMAPLSGGAAHQLAGQGAGRLAVPVGDGAGEDGGVVAARLLHQPPPAARQVVEHARPLERQRIPVDDVDVGAQAGLQQAAIVQAG